MSPRRPPDVLVTGATGFLGGVLLQRLLADGRSIRVLSRSPVLVKSPHEVDVIAGDLRDPSAVMHAAAGIDTIFHVGAATRGNLQEQLASTVRGTLNVIEATVHRGVRRLVYVSSLAVLDHAGRDRSVSVTEQTALEPYPSRRGAYTQAKSEAESEIRAAISRLGLPAVILRPGQIVGPGSERVAPNGTFAIGGRWVAVGSAAQRLPLVYVDDVVDALCLAAIQPAIEGSIFTVVDPEPVTQGEYLDACARKLGADLSVTRLPLSVVLVCAGAVEAVAAAFGRQSSFTRYRVRSLSPIGDIDLRATRDQLGWTPRVGVREGLRRTFG